MTTARHTTATPGRRLPRPGSGTDARYEVAVTGGPSAVAWSRDVAEAVLAKAKELLPVLTFEIRRTGKAK